MFHWLKSLFQPSQETAVETIDSDTPPTAAEIQAASLRLDELVKLAIFGEIGDAEPDENNRARSWWGGNFLGAKGETVPVSKAFGHEMHPLLQIRVDELPEIPPAFSGLALITIWLDTVELDLFDNDTNNSDGFFFCVRTYTSLCLLYTSPSPRD